jgi:uncharacterized protein (TIGR00369 family)
MFELLSVMKLNVRILAIGCDNINNIKPFRFGLIMNRTNDNLLDVNTDSACFVCGGDNPIGLQVEFTIDSKQNRASAKLTIGTNFQGWQGVVHGGIIAALLDETAIYACRQLSKTAVTAGMSVRYKHPVRVDCQVSLLAEVVSVRRSIAVVKSSLTVDTVIMAEAEVKVMLLKTN